MKYTIFGFNQEKAIENNLDIEDLLILQWITDFVTRVPEKIINDKKYYWIKYKELLEDIPILGFKSKDRLYRKLNELVERGILIHKTVKAGGTYSYYGFGENYPKLLEAVRKTEKTEGKELADNFDKIWKLYPRKDGKNTAFNHYKAWLKGKKYAGRIVKLDNRQMWYAVAIYAYKVEEKAIEKQFIKMGSTFFNEAIMEYVEIYNANIKYWQVEIDKWKERK